MPPVSVKDRLYGSNLTEEQYSGLSDGKKLRIRFLDYIVSREGHWIWVGNRSNHGGSRSRGAICWNHKGYAVGRFSMFLFCGFDLNSKEQVNHVRGCNNKFCVNPSHLYIGTQYENLLDARALRTHCRNGHEFTPENTVYESCSGARRCRICRERMYEERRSRQNQ